MLVFTKTHLLAAVVQGYETDVIKEFVIRGNDALVRCSIPSYVAWLDFVTVVSWTILTSRSDKLEVSRGLMGKTKFEVIFFSTYWHHHHS